MIIWSRARVHEMRDAEGPSMRDHLLNFNKSHCSRYARLPTLGPSQIWPSVLAWLERHLLVGYSTKPLKKLGLKKYKDLIYTSGKIRWLSNYVWLFVVQKGNLNRRMIIATEHNFVEACGIFRITPFSLSVLDTTGIAVTHESFEVRIEAASAWNAYQYGPKTAVWNSQRIVTEPPHV